MTTYYHGGKPGLDVGDLLQSSPPHVTDGCPVCVARSEGRGVTVAEYRAWLAGRGPSASRLLAMLADEPDDYVIDPPTQREAVYFTTVLDYALFYAARSGHGDLYEVEPVGDAVQSEEDHFTTFYAPAARVVRVVRRVVWLTRQDRRRIERAWKRADKTALLLAEREVEILELKAQLEDQTLLSDRELLEEAKRIEAALVELSTAMMEGGTP